ncbi:MAG: redox-sensing transcriptional repressor Rex [Candidatus Omnitrophota bacterium]
MSNNKRISSAAISRLFTYLREVIELVNMNIRKISSSDLGSRLNLSDAQVRKDLGHFGQFGVSGSGYNTKQLQAELEKILGKDKQWNIVVVGVGCLGSALMSYAGFNRHGLKIVAALDNDGSKIGNYLEGMKIESMEQVDLVVKQKNVSIAIMTIPAAHAQVAADKLIESGVTCILNFAPIALNVPNTVMVKNVDLSRELETLSYFLANKAKVSS